MTVKELRDKLDSFIAAGAADVDPEVYFYDDELGMKQVNEDSVRMVVPLDTIAGRPDNVRAYETICCLNTDVDDRSGRMFVGGKDVVSPETLEVGGDESEKVLVRIGQILSEKVYWSEGFGRKFGQLEGMPLNDEMKDLLKVYRAQFVECAKGAFESEYRGELLRHFTSEQVRVVEAVATELPPLAMKLSGEEFNPRGPKTAFMGGIVVTYYDD